MSGELLQLHHQFADYTEFKAQREIHGRQEYNQWLKEVQEEYPLPEGAQWLACTEDDEHFVKMAAPEAHKHPE